MARVIDLFCGIGGLTNGLIQAGLNVVAGIDVDNQCRFAYEENNNSVFINKNIFDVTKDDIVKLFGHDPITILVGCAPCQPFSNHQKEKKERESHKDWGLLYEFIRLIKETLPSVISMENVPTLLKEKVFFDFIQSLENLGYHINYRVHDAEKYGIGQRRKRLILLASRLGAIEFAEDEEEPKVLRDIIGHLPSIQAGEENLEDKYHISSKLSPLNLKRIVSSTPGGTWEEWEDSLIPDCFKRKSGKTYKSVYGRMKYDSVSPTLTTQFNAYGTGRFGHPTQNRAISIREGALLQSFSSEYKFTPENEKVRISVLARQIGNALPPRLGLHIGRSIIEHLKKISG